MPRVRYAQSSVDEELRLQAPAEDGDAVDVTQIDGKPGALRVDVYFAEELESAERREVRPSRRGRLEEHDLRSKGGVEYVRPEAAGIERPRDKFPERIEIVERAQACRLMELFVVR